MKLARTGIIAAAMLAVATVAYAQKPDFSGAWAPEAAAAAPEGGRGRGMMAPGPMTVKQTADSLTIERSMGGNTVTQTYKLDGTETENKMTGRGGMEMVSKSTAKWDGSKLVITTKQTGPDGQERASSQTWSLEAGNLVIERPGRGGEIQKTVYKKTT